MITAQITTLIKDLNEAGFTPMTSLLIAAVLFLAGYIKINLAIQNQLRENWHNDTRDLVSKTEAKVALLEAARKDDLKHIEDCNKDRQNLHEQVKRLVDQIDDYQRCPEVGCPFRKKIHL